MEEGKFEQYFLGCYFLWSLSVYIFCVVFGVLNDQLLGSLYNYC